MNTYAKFCPNVFVAKCTEKHERDEEIIVTTKYGKENKCIVFNLVYQKDGFYYYSIIRSDGFNSQERAKNKADKLMDWAISAKKKSDEYWKRSEKDSAFLSLAEPIKVGHHSEKRHRKIIKECQDNTQKSCELRAKAEGYKNRIDYWESRAEKIDLSMPESIDYFEAKLQQKTAVHKLLKENKELRRHAYDLTYAKKEVNEAKKNYELAKRLWQ